MKAEDILSKLQSGEMVLVKRETAQKMGLHPEAKTVVEVVEDRIKRAAAGERVPELDGKPIYTYGDYLNGAFGMPRDSAQYKEAVQRVKISYLTENLGLDIKGIIHVGANDGYEMQWYKKMGIRHLMGIEPLPSAIKLFKEHYPDIPLGEFALGDVEGNRELYVASGDGQGSSFLRELGRTTWKFEGTVQVPVHRWDDLIGVQYEKYDCLVMDVQGYELPALIGFGDKLDYIQCINIELSSEPIYEGGAPALVVIRYLEDQGFVQMSRTEEHNDVFFVRKGTTLKNLKINLGSGQRPFESPWINVDVQDKWKPHIVADGASMPMFPDGSAEMIVLHHVLEHFGCGEADAMLWECHRTLKPGGSLIVTVPDMRGLCQAWLYTQWNKETVIGGMYERATPSLDTQLFLTNLYGAYMGDEADRHKWGFDETSLGASLARAGFSFNGRFDFRRIPGADIAKDWWILGMEAVK